MKNWEVWARAENCGKVWTRIGDYRYSLNSTGSDSGKYGLCEVCSKHASEVFIQAEQQVYFDGGMEAWTGFHCRHATFGHEACLIQIRR